MPNYHKTILYNKLLILSRNIFFYNKINLPDTFETRIYLMFIHFSVILIVYKNKGSKLDQKIYDYLFHNIEYNLRESGLGDVSVNKKMKEFNKILYDILLKINLENKNLDRFKVNHNLISKYFSELKDKNGANYLEFDRYFTKFFYFCYELSLDNMIESSDKFKF
tara:strand:- start:1094 stop:1588 length:495 start_codon:yes stop_codon:yes gene_type:complete